MSLRNRTVTEAMTASPKTMEESCEILRITAGSHVHQTLLHAIMQYTSYHKQHVNSVGSVLPRLLNADQTLSELFDPKFLQIIDTFLIEKRAGERFFPLFLPMRPGWGQSCLEKKLHWEIDEDRIRIRAGMQLLFENLRANEPVIDMNTVSISSNFGQDCCECGSGYETDGNSIVFCGECTQGYHQKCYGIQDIPAGKWLCYTCTSSQASQHADEIAKPLGNSARPNKRVCVNDWQDLVDNVVRSSKKVMIAVNSGSMSASNNLQPAAARLPTAGPVNFDGGQAQPLSSSAPAEAIANQSSQGNAGRGLQINHQEAQSAIDEVVSVSDIDAPEVEDDPYYSENLNPDQRERTTLVTALNGGCIKRLLPFAPVTCTEDLFQHCASRWPERLWGVKDNIARMWVHCEEQDTWGINSFIEITRGSDHDFSQLLRVIKMAWKPDVRAVFIKFYILEQGVPFIEGPEYAQGAEYPQYPPVEYPQYPPVEDYPQYPPAEEYPQYPPVEEYPQYPHLLPGQHCQHFGHYPN